MQYVGIDWAYRRAAWCALGEGGSVSDEGVVAADEDGLARLVLRLGIDVRACVEMMSGRSGFVISWRRPAGRFRSRTRARSATSRRWPARPTRVDARVLAELCRRDLVP